MTGTLPTPIDRERIAADVPEILRRIASDVNPGFTGTIGDATRVIADLEFTSVSIVELCMTLGKQYGAKPPFQQMVFKDGRFRDFTVSELVAFLARHVSA
jgi:acyl carrier protein